MLRIASALASSPSARAELIMRTAAAGTPNVMKTAEIEVALRRKTNPPAWAAGSDRRINVTAMNVRPRSSELLPNMSATLLKF
jgi:hypothetical protein